MLSPESRESTPPTPQRLEFTASEIGALAHLYRGEVYRSTVWRTRLDSSTNWAVVTTGIALSATYSNATASPLPMVLVGLLVFAEDAVMLGFVFPGESLAAPPDTTVPEPTSGWIFGTALVGLFEVRRFTIRRAQA